ncbi:ubiquinol-cytochrome c reductase iron-sulfur subunit [Marinomonas mediterranea]|uniref:ubiquinol-cytochrome c reductase iron-sulfur subunit n=1 Tax=Marinomonas mediterranea TaxID=119864 RepID=UPI00234B47F8|nr:ubiquinol-cytochrome c reductase iron-sulfur subunit [Marinomonas mediterranea]WCN09089.1 ubiquinol-cytochrome c reductase iron-sulfur subunit [Marinomonas mediterranea]
MSRHLHQSSRRRFLVGATGAMGVASAIGVATPFVCALAPNEKVKQQRLPVQVDVSKIEPGAIVTVAWHGLPVWVLRRAKTSLLALEEHVSILADPESSRSQQPDNTRNTFRSIRPEIAVYVGRCTHLGCTPNYRPLIASSASEGMVSKELGEDWYGGFFCPCHGSKFDLAGRVYKNMPAPTNLEVPPYRFIGDDVLEIGITGDGDNV